MNHGSPFLDQPNGPSPPSPARPWLDEARQPGPLTLPRFDPVAAPTRRRGRPWVNLALFLATVVTTTMAGACHYDSFASDFGPIAEAPLVPWRGLWYSATILAILGAHEFGHYYACRYYRVDASLPYFLPAPFLTGTLGAVISIRQQIPTKRMLFDIGVAGPIAGFAVAVPALFLGLGLSRVLLVPEDVGVLSLARGAAVVSTGRLDGLGHGPGRLLLDPPPGGSCRVVRSAHHRPEPLPDRSA